jgi:PAS domain S-box-containing protein
MSDTVRILHVDDDPAAASTTAEYLESAHEEFVVVTEHAGADALDAILPDPEAFDCIVSDYQMPGMDGLELLQTLQSRHPDLAIPFILFTGEGNEDVAAEALHAGASSYVQKGGRDTYEHLAERIRHDIQAEKAARASERFDTLVDALDDPVYVLDAEGRFTFVNDALVDLIGYSREEILGSTPELFKDDEAVEEAERQLAKLLSDDGPDDVTFEVTLQPREGDSIPCEDHMGVLPYEGESFQGSLGVLRDITDRKERERSLLRSKEQYQRLVEHNLVGLYIARDGTLVYHNEQFANLLGYPSEANALVGQQFTSFLEAADRDRLVEALGRGIELEGDPAVIGTVVDVGKDEEQYWELRRERDRLEEFTSIISHDLRNPLNVAQLQLDTAQRQLMDDDALASLDDDALESLDGVAGALDRMEELLEDLLALARQGRTVDDREAVGLTSLAQSTWNNVATEDADLTITASGTIQADPSRIKGVFENLYRNAVEHAGPEVLVEVGALPDGFYVADDGPGIPPEERDQIFESGYTTADRGTGFGLAIVEEIVSAHGWEIEVTEGEAGGARFEVVDDKRSVRGETER